MPQTLLVAPSGRQVGLTTSCLGLVRALDRLGARVAFVKPVAARGVDRTVALMKQGARLSPPAPIARAEAEALLAAGDDQTLLERVVALCNDAAKGADVLVVAGMEPEPGMVWATRMNNLMLKALDAELVLVGAPAGDGPADAASAVAIAAAGYAPLPEGRVVGAILNRLSKQAGDGRSTWVDAGIAAPALTADDLGAYRTALEAKKLKPVAVLPATSAIASPRVKDVADAIGAKPLRAGDYEKRRVTSVALAASTAPTATRYFKPGALIVTPGDRTDIIEAAALAVQNGTPLAGLLLTGGIVPGDKTLALCEGALKTGFPILTVETTTFPTATAVANMDLQIAEDDGERIDRVMNTVADQIDPAWVKAISGSTRAPRLSPPAFRYKLVETARALNKRIVLPEGAEPRTVKAAAIAQERGIARCVLLGNPDEIRAVAEKQGVKLPASIEIIDAAKAAPRYVDPLVERRKHKGMTPQAAAEELSDTIMLGTMMMALDEVDGLVSGAVHTTAHTVRPALQLIKTSPGCNLVSSIFFMCLPEQVLVFGDCAIVPNPTVEELADIAIQSADSAAAFGIEPRVAMLSYSTGTSGAGPEVEKVAKATELARKLRPDLAVDGPLQYDAALMPDVGRSKAPKSPVAGKATVYVFPDLNTGNVTYKAVQRSANALAMGPMLQGMAKPVNDLSRGCLVEDIVFTIALTAIQAEQAKNRKK
ncbi:MAG TPA: phosphate acetyltransferase [Anaeromyxobacteraceae bacterium]|nr:phosphate acetyltransferase [Anaeromyxobacteraceae bacterium]